MAAKKRRRRRREKTFQVQSKTFANTEIFRVFINTDKKVIFFFISENLFSDMKKTLRIKIFSGNFQQRMRDEIFKHENVPHCWNYWFACQVQAKKLHLSWLLDSPRSWDHFLVLFPNFLFVTNSSSWYYNNNNDNKFMS